MARSSRPGGSKDGASAMAVGEVQAGVLSGTVPAPGRESRPLQAAVVGVSKGRTCGMRDHAILLADALGDEDVSCSVHWLWRSALSIRAVHSEFRSWTSRLASELDANPPDAIIFHYSVFSYSYKGFPLFVRPTLSALRGSWPLITVLHEFAYPWRYGGLHGDAWAVTQRAAMVGVMKRSAAVLVTAPFREEWLASRRWLPRRPIAFAPVFSNLPAATVAGRAADRAAEGVVGLFGYAYEGADAALVLDAVRLLHDRGLPVRLKLLGAPGPGTPAAERWLADATDRGLERALSFSGLLEAQELANALAACDVLLHVARAGPTSRKGTLAASLASGRPVVALDGPRRWAELAGSGAALIVAPTAVAMADAVAGLLEDRDRREALGARSAAFARGAMGVQRSARAVRGLLDAL